MDATAILQRTSTGLETVKTKSVRLTQSERLILIVVDGVTPYAQLREKVWALSPERFTLALNTLLEKELIFEVLLPDATRLPEVLDSSVIDHFLHQDPLDPVTIISVDPEDHFGTDLIAEMGHAPPSPASVAPVEIRLPRPTVAAGAGSPAVPPPSARTPDALPAPHTAAAPARSANDALPLQKSIPAPVARHTAAGIDGHGANAAPPAPRNSESIKPSRTMPAPAAGIRRNTVSGNAARSGLRTDSHGRPDARAKRASKKQSVDVLKLFSWTGLISGFAIFIFLLLHHYGAAI